MILAILLFSGVSWTSGRVSGESSPKPAFSISQKIENVLDFRITAAEASEEDSKQEPVYSGFCQRVPILMYHHIEPMDVAAAAGHAQFTVSPAVFEAQMQYLAASGYTTLFVDEVVDFLSGQRQLPQKSIVLTFDDGYLDFYQWGYPIIGKYNLKANLLISTGLLENPGYLTWGQLKQMVGSGRVSVVNHTWSHYNLASADSAKMEFEVDTAQKQFEEYLGTTPRVFGYPYGGVNQSAIDFLTSRGFAGALSTIDGTLQCDSFLMSLHRTRVGNAPLSSYGI